MATYLFSLIQIFVIVYVLDDNVLSLMQMLVSYTLVVYWTRSLSLLHCYVPQAPKQNARGGPVVSPTEVAARLGVVALGLSSYLNKQSPFGVQKISQAAADALAQVQVLYYI